MTASPWQEHRAFSANQSERGCPTRAFRPRVNARVGHPRSGRMGWWMLALLLAAGLLRAADKPPVAEKQGGKVESKEFFFEMNTGLMVYKGKVAVEDPEMELRCDALKFKYAVGGTNAPVATNAPAVPFWGGKKVEWADAMGNVVIHDRKNDARVEGRQALYTSSNNILQLPGRGFIVKPQNATTNWAAAQTNKSLVSPTVLFIGEDLVMDRAKGTVSGRNHQTFYWAEQVKTNAPAAPNPEKKP